MRFLLPILLLSSCLASPDNKTQFTPVGFKKPSPCHKIGGVVIRGEVMKVLLKGSGQGHCAQIITEDRVLLKRDVAERVKKIEVYVGEKLWMEFRR